MATLYLEVIVFNIIDITKFSATVNLTSPYAPINLQSILRISPFKAETPTDFQLYPTV